MDVTTWAKFQKIIVGKHSSFTNVSTEELHLYIILFVLKKYDLGGNLSFATMFHCDAFPSEISAIFLTPETEFAIS